MSLYTYALSFTQVITTWSPGVTGQPIEEGAGFYFPKVPLSKTEAETYV